MPRNRTRRPARRRPTAGRPGRAPAAACLAAVAACGSGAGAPDEERPPNVVLYVIDTLRADRLSSYGREDPLTPAIDRLAAQSVVFEHAVAQGPWTLPSMASLVTSSYPATHRIIDDGRRIRDEIEILPEYLRRHGYVTAGFVKNPLAGPVIGADVGYDEYYGPGEGPAPERWVLDLEVRRPFFLYVHTAEPHIPYSSWAGAAVRVDPELRERVNEELDLFSDLTHSPLEEGTPARARMLEARAFLEENVDVVRALYDAEVRRADGGVQALLGALDEAGRLEDSVVILTSDHGEELLDRGYFLHDHSLHAELLRVPLIVRVPGVEPRRVEEPVQLIDLLPTLADLIGGEPDERWQGRSLAPLLEGRAVAPRAAHANRLNVSTKDPFVVERRGDFEYALVRGDRKAIYHADQDRLSLYDLAADPEETRDLAAEEPELAAELTAEIEAWIEAHATAEGWYERRELSSEEADAMRALGYTPGRDDG